MERQSVLIDTVKRGAMVFQVRGTGTLVPVDVRMITAQVPCKVERILLYPGTPVTEESVIAELSSPELQQAAVDALWQMRRAEADYEVDRLNQRATLDSTRANAREARATLLATERLRKEGLQSDLDVLRAQVRADEITGRLAAEEARAGLFESSGREGGSRQGQAGAGQGAVRPQAGAGGVACRSARGWRASSSRCSSRWGSSWPQARASRRSPSRCR